MPNQITATYELINGEMVHSGYFIYGNGAPLQWVSVDHVERVYK